MRSHGENDRFAGSDGETSAGCWYRGRLPPHRQLVRLSLGHQGLVPAFASHLYAQGLAKGSLSISEPRSQNEQTEPSGKVETGKGGVIKASIMVRCGNGINLKIVFVKHRKKKGGIALATTGLNLADEEIIRLYGKRWGIEVFFKTVKHLLNLEREMQVRDYDAVFGHMTVVFCRYLFMSLEQRLMTDSRTAGELFSACCNEIRDLTLIESLQLAFSLLRDKINGLCHRLTQARKFSSIGVNSHESATMTT